MKRSLKLRIDDILKSIRLIERYIHEKNKSAFEKDITVQDAVIRRLEIIGEATKHVSSEIRYKYKEVPWRKMAGLRDVAIHDYADLLLERIWNTLKKDLPSLKKLIKRVKKDLEKGSEPG